MVKRPDGTVTRSARGRRPGASTTRDAILAAARRQFAELGYDRATVRGIAAEAGVDPKLVSHWFGSKQELFLQVVELPIRPAEVFPALLAAGSRDDLGPRLATFLLGQMDTERVRTAFLSLLRAAASEPSALPLLRDLLQREILGPLSEALGGDDEARLRASLMASQVVGLVMVRYLVGIEPLASQPVGAVVDAVAPVLQRYLTGPLDEPGAPV